MKSTILAFFLVCVSWYNKGAEVKKRQVWKMTELEQILIKKLELANEQNRQLTEQLALLTEQVQLLTQKLFGRSSEKSKITPTVENQLILFTDEDLNLYEAEIDQDKKAPEISQLEDLKVKRHTMG